MRYRRRGVAIVETKKGILLVGRTQKKFILPGGGAKKYESRKKAAIRELYEETGLKTEKIKYLFSRLGKRWHYNNNGKPVKNNTDIFLVEASGKPKPGNEIRYIKFWSSKRKIRMSNGADEVIKNYLKSYK